jgi:very-short-patch-repair endonuclease
MKNEYRAAMENPKVLHYVVEIARRLRRNQTSTEEILWACLRNRRLCGNKFRRQQPLGRYIADFYCHEAKLVVEIQGGIHSHEDQREYDDIRQEVIEQLGIKILSFTNEEVTQNLEDTLSKIINTLPPNPATAQSPLSLWERGRG